MFEEYKNKLNDCINDSDTESAHIDGDNILMQILLDEKFIKTSTLEQREELVRLYNNIGKWFA